MNKIKFDQSNVMENACSLENIIQAEYECENECEDE